MTFLAKFIFVSATWCPVYVLIAVLSWSSGRLSYVMIGLAVFSALGVWAIKKIAELRFSVEAITVTTIEQKEDDLFMYILSYIPPFFAADLSTAPKQIALLVLYVIIFATYVRLDQYHLNPLFVFAGYRVYKIKTIAGNTVHLIAKSPPQCEDGGRLRVVRFDELALLAER